MCQSHPHFFKVATCVVLHNMCDLHGNMCHMELEDTPDSEVMPSPSTTAETNSSRMRDAIMHLDYCRLLMLIIEAICLKIFKAQ